MPHLTLLMFAKGSYAATDLQPRNSGVDPKLAIRDVGLGLLWPFSSWLAANTSPSLHCMATVVVRGISCCKIDEEIFNRIFIEWPL